MISPLVFKKKITNDDQTKLDWLRLIRTENLGPITFYKLLDRYGSAANALAAIPNLNADKKKPFVIPSPRTVEKEYEAIIKAGAHILTTLDPAYPVALSQIDDAPPVITVKGNLELLNKPSLALVGSRSASINGFKFTEHLAEQLGNAGQIIVSGLARGIDTAAHKGSLKTGTIAVVAGGIDIVYPKENQKLYESMCEQGLIIAESPLGTAPRARDFPRRNRIVSGISQGTIVVEAAERSGSLITARLAAEQGRDVYAVPGHPFDPRAAGPNKLIRDGAILIRSADDVLSEINLFNLLAPKKLDVKRSAKKLTDIQTDKNISSENAHEKILKAISSTPTSIDDLIESCGIPAGELQSILSELELTAQIARVSGNRVIRVNPS